MKRKRLAKNEQSLKEQENPSSTKSLRSNITGKLQSLLNGFVSELQNISEDKRQDVAKLFSSEYEKANSTENSSVVDSAFPSLANSSDSTKVLENFIGSAKSRISGLLSSKPQNQGSNGNNLKNFQSSAQPKTIFIDPLEIQINLKFQGLLFKAFDSKKPNNVNKKQKPTPSESIITKKDWQDLSRMLQNFNQSTKKKHSSVIKTRSTRLLNGSAASIQNYTVKESWSSRATLLSLSQRKGHNKELHKPSVKQGNSSSCSIDSTKLTKKNSKLLKMDFLNESTDSSSSPRNPFDEGCMLLLSDAEKCPQYIELHLSSESDIDELDDAAEPSISPVQQSDSPVQQSDSEDEVIVLGEKSKTYQEVTLEEDDDGQVHESVIEKVLEKPLKEDKEIEEVVFDCPKCGKSFRVQSLLQFHVKMHATESASSKDYPNSSSTSEEESCSSERPRNVNHRARKEKENTKISTKKASIKKSHREKYKKRKNKESSKCSL